MQGNSARISIALKTPTADVLSSRDVELYFPSLSISMEFSPINAHSRKKLRIIFVLMVVMFVMLAQFVLETPVERLCVWGKAVAVPPALFGISQIFVKLISVEETL